MHVRDCRIVIAYDRLYVDGMIDDSNDCDACFWYKKSYLNCKLFGLWFTKEMTLNQIYLFGDLKEKVVRILAGGYF